LLHTRTPPLGTPVCPNQMVQLVESSVVPVLDTPWTLRAVVERGREVLRQEGVKSLWFRTLGELGYRRAMLFELDLATYQQSEAAPASARFELLSPSNLEDLLGLVQQCDEREATRRLAAGHVCMLGYVKGRPAYSSWLATGPVRIDFLGVQAVPSPGSAYSYELYVGPAFRGLSLATAGLDVRVRILRDRGFKRFVSIVVPENQAGLRHALAGGFQPIGWVYCLDVGSPKRCWVRSSLASTPLQLVR
jgi:ribosomal protein S18 acetylase RimI-like enzyme